MRLQDIGPEFQASESITVSTTSVGLTAATAAQYPFALITVENAAVRFWLDGTAPTATVGHVLEAGDKLDLNSSDQVLSARFIRRDGVDGVIRVSYGK
jgi:hypothetical protein